MSNEQEARTRTIKDILTPGDRGIILDSIDPVSFNDKITDLRNISRIQSAVNLFDPLRSYKINDIVDYNGTLYQAIAVVLGNEEFDPIQWKFVNGAQNVVHVRSLADLPNGVPKIISSVSNDGGNPKFNTSTPHTYTNRQRVKISGYITNPLYNNFFQIRVDSGTGLSAFVVESLSFSGSETDKDVIRTLAPNINYILDIPVQTPWGFVMVDRTSNGIFSSNLGINILVLIPGGTVPQTMFTVDQVNGLRIQSCNVADATGGLNQKFSTGILFDVTNKFANDSTHVLNLNNSLFVSFDKIGVVNNVLLAWGNMGWINANSGIFVNDCIGGAIGLGFVSNPADNKAGANNVMITQNSIVNPTNSLVFATITPLLQAGASVFDIKPSLLSTSTLNVSSSGKTLGGQYFKPSSQKISIITAITDGGGGTVIFASAGHNFVAGSRVRLRDTINYNRDFDITSVVAGVSFTITTSFITETVDPAKRIPNAIEIFPITGFAPGTVSENGLTTGFSFDDTPTTGTGLTTVSTGGTLPASVISGRMITIALTGAHNGTFRIINVTATTFDILRGDVAEPDPNGTWSLDTTKVTVDVGTNPGYIANDKSILIDKTIFHDGGFIMRNVIGNISFEIDLKHNVLELLGGEISDGSLAEKQANVLVSDIIGQANSKVKGSIFYNDAVGVSTDAPGANVFTDILLVASSIIETDDNESFRLIDPESAREQYRGLEPFSGELFVRGTVKKTNGNASIGPITFRAVKNDGAMVDNITVVESIGKLAIPFSFFIPVTGKFEDDFHIQFSGTEALTFTNVLQTIVD